MCFLIQMLINTRIERERETTFSQEHVIHTRTRALYTCVCDRARLSLSLLSFSLFPLSLKNTSLSLSLSRAHLSLYLFVSLSLSLSLSLPLEDTQGHVGLAHSLTSTSPLSRWHLFFIRRAPNQHHICTSTSWRALLCEAVCLLCNVHPISWRVSRSPRQ